MKTAINAIAFFLLMGATMQVSTADTITWSGGGADNNFTNGLNWVGGTAPTDADDAIINHAGPGTLSVTLDGADFNGGAGSLTLTGDISAGFSIATTQNLLNGYDFNLGDGVTFGTAGNNFRVGGSQNGGAVFNFPSGGMTSLADWEANNTLNLNFDLISSGFTQSTISNFDVDADRTLNWNVDMSSYTGGDGILTLFRSLNGAGSSADITSVSTFNLSGEGATYAGSSLAWVYDAADITGAGELQLTVVPEPSSTVLMALGLGACWLLRRRR